MYHLIFLPFTITSSSQSMANDWVVSITKQLQKLHEVESPSSSSIFIVPRPLRDVQPLAFTPRTVAIGPYHSNLPFPDMQRFKILAAKAIAEDMASKDFRQLVQDFLKAEKEVLSYYDTTHIHAIEEMTGERLALMVALDAALIVELLHSFFDLHVNRRIDLSVPELPSRFATVFSHHFSLPVQKSLMHDFLLIENQIPLFVLRKMILVDSRCKSKDEAESRLESFIGTLALGFLPFTKSPDLIRKAVLGTAAGGKHLLDCLYLIVTKSSSTETKEDSCLDFDPPELPSATELSNAGVKFRGHNGSLMDISFEHRVLTIPKIHVGDDTEGIFRNLVAYESHLEGKVDILSYLHFMNFLINTPEDVGILVESGIITQTIGNNDRVARMWNELCINTVAVFSPRYSEVACAAKQHADAKINGLIAEFVRTYCSRPWLLISLISGIALLIMTFITMLYTMEVYYNG